MPTTCEIHFINNQTGIFFPGQKIFTTVRLKLTEELKYRTFYIRIQGTARVRFTTDDCKRDGNFVANEIILDVQKRLFHGNGETKILSPGTYDCSFEYTLPYNLPSSYSCPYKIARIKYKAIVVLHIPLWPDKTFEKEFTVFRPLDLNENPSLKNPVTDQIEEMIYTRQRALLGPSVQSGLVSIIVRVPFSGYSHGQMINFEIEVNNRTSHPFLQIPTFLVRRTVSSKSPNSKHYKTANLAIAGGFPNIICQKNMHKTFPVSICVPKAIPPTDTDESNIVKITYLIYVIGCMHSFVHREPFMLKLPVTIGSMPLRDSETNTIPITNPRIGMNPSAPPISAASSSMSLVLKEPSAPTLPDDDAGTIRTYTSTPPPFPDDELGLPTFSEAVSQGIDLDSLAYSFSQLFNSSTKNKTK